MLGWAQRLEARAASARSRTPDPLGFGEYLAQIAGGIPMSQGETVRLATRPPRGQIARLAPTPSRR